MKNITNILSYLWLLLLIAVTACSDLEEEVDPMKGEEEVELTIRTQVPGMKVGTRVAETENLTTITALVFNAEKELIKKVDNIVASTTSNTQGTFTLKVPLRTRSIHFIGNPTGVNLPSVPSEGDAAVTYDALKTLTTTGSLAYWGYASFADVAALRAYKNQTLILYRNKAKISIEKAGTFNGSLAIAGLENVYKKGVLVPHNGDEFNFDLTNYDYQTLPTSVSNEEKGQEKYQQAVEETYVFEHPNDEGNELFTICLINQKYYKVALAKNNSGTLSYYDIIRNHQYRIKINAITESLGQDSYEAAVNSDPINNAEAEVEETKDAVLTIESISANELVYNTGNKQLSMTVNIPEGVSALTINAPNFTASTTDGNLSSTGNNAFNVNSAGRVTFTLTLNNGVGSRGQQETISVVGTAKEGYSVTNPESKTIILKEQVSLQTSLLEGVSSLMYSNEENSESDLIVNVTIPAGVTTLEFSSDYFDVISANGRTKKETVDGVEVSTPYITGSGPYTVNHQSVGELTLPFRLRLKSEKKAPTSSAWFEFDGSGEGVKVVPATMSNITLTENDDEYVRWQGDVLLDWGNEGAVTQIPLPYSWFEGLSPGSTLRVDYKTTDNNGGNAVIQFAEVDGDWNKPTEDSYYFEELNENMDDGGKMGLNLSNKSYTNIYTNNYIELNITQAVLDNIIKMNNRNITLLGENNVVMAIQGENARLKKISVMPAAENPNNPLSITLDFYQTEGENLGDGATYDLKAGSTPFYLKATISSDDAEKYSGQTVLLNGTFSSSKGYGKDKNGIHWDYSEIDTPKDGYGKIACNSDGTQLQFTIDPDETDYLIEWVFVPGGQYSGDDINFTYQISGATVDDKPCTLNNESQTTLNVDVLDISLDFDYPATFDGSPAPLDNMVFGVSNFYLRATISQADATAFAGSQVLLAGAFSATSGGGNDAVSWYVSRVEGTIGYDDNFNGTGLLFTIDANQQNYFIHWCFERYNYGEDPASFTYTISKPENANYRFFRVSGETETSLTLKNSAEIFSGTYLFNTGNVWDKFYSISETFPVGTKITVGFGAGQRNDGGSTVKFCDAASQNALKVPSFTGVEYGLDNNLYFSFTGSKTFEVWVNETTELYVNGDGSGNGNSGTPNGNLSNKPLEGFKIEGTDAILQSITVTAPESALRNAQDNNNE